MRIKNIVKVMNMHSLIRVEASKKTAEKYLQMEQELIAMISKIVNNRNIKEYNSIIKGKKNGKTLNIYIGSDFGFCGSYNYQIIRQAHTRSSSEKVVIGKKIFREFSNIKMKFKKDEFDEHINELMEIIKSSILKNTYSKINIVYYRYNKVGDLKLTTKRLFPVDIDIEKNYNEDFIYDGNIKDILLNLILTYTKYEIIIANLNSKASENIMRQENTSESIKKIDEVEQQKRIEERKIRKKKEFEKVSSNFSKLKIF